MKDAPSASVLMIRPLLEPGGASEHISLLARGLKDAGLEVLMATSGGLSVPSLHGQGLETIGSPLHPSSLSNLLLASRRIVRITRDREISILHSHHRFATLVGRLAGWMTRTPLVVTVHEYRHSHRYLGRMLGGEITIVPSKALAADLVSYYQMDPSRITVIPNAIPIEGDVGGVPQKPGRLHVGVPTVGFLGRLSEEKGARFFLESAPIISRQFPDTRFLVFGEGTEEPELTQLARELGIAAGHLSFEGWTDPLEATGQLDIVVIPSLDEGFGLVALEAMRASLPVVATSVGGLPEIVVDGESGLLVPPRSPDAIASAVCRLLGDPEMRRKLGRRGRAILEERFSLEQMVRSTIDVYEQVLGRLVRQER